MYKECAEACVKREPCIDLEANCAFWKGLGECVKNAGYMINHCPVSCEGRAASSGWCTGTCDQKRSVVHDALDTISQIVGHADRNASEQAHFLDLAPGQQYGLRHEFVLDQTLTAAGPRIYSAVVFLDDADQGGELWFPDLNIAVPPKAGTLVIYANVKRDDYLAPEPRTRHAHRALADGAPHHVRACVEIKLRRVPRPSHRREMT